MIATFTLCVSCSQKPLVFLRLTHNAVAAKLTKLSFIKPALYGSSFLVANVTRKSGVLRGSYEETAAVEFSLYALRL